MVKKKCFKCSKRKPLLEFYKHSQMADGHLNKCKSCTKNDNTKHRNSNLDKIRDYDRSRGSRQEYGYLQDFRYKYPKAYKAHSKVAYALRIGDLKKGRCEKCGISKTVAHHDDYNKPLKVRWLCQAHHKQWHAKNGNGKNRV